MFCVRGREKEEKQKKSLVPLSFISDGDFVDGLQKKKSYAHTGNFPTPPFDSLQCLPDTFF
jgi:hypothetical protein